MSPEAQRIAIAEVCGTNKFWLLKKRGYWWRPNSAGYTDRVSEAGRYTEEEASARTRVNGHQDDVTKHPAPIPDYLNDLNAMHEAVKQRIDTEELCERFAGLLRESAGVNGASNAIFRGYWEMGVSLLNAAAAQRAEAFLKTIGKWGAA